MSRLALAIPAPPLHGDVVRIARDARRRGLESFWLTEGLGKDALVQLGAVAAQVKGITLGTAIVNTYSRSATVLAMAAAALDDITGGRFILGLGPSLRNVIEDRHGIPFHQPLHRMRDYISVIRQAVTGQPVTHDGAAYSVRDVQLQVPAPQARLPIYIAVVGLHMARLAGEVADGVILHMASRGHVGRVRQAIAEGAAAAGRNPAEIDVACLIMCHASRDEAQAHRIAIDAVAHYGMIPHYRKYLDDMGFHQEAAAFLEAWQRRDTDGAARCVSERLFHEISAAGGAEDVRRKVEAFRQAGVDLPMLYPIAGPQGTTQSVLEVLKAAAPL